MCGITGYFGIQKLDVSRFHKAHLLLKHRGPDDEGYLISKKGLHLVRGDTTMKYFSRHKHILDFDKSSLMLGHWRLSIIDLSHKGHQPMTDGRFYIIYNGEIYNYIELRNELIAKGYDFHSDSDTEVFLKAYSEWGTDCFNKLNGMWAAAIYDSKEDRLILTRDRFGIKPLYYHLDKNCLYFASEIKFLLPFLKKRVVDKELAIEFILNVHIDHVPETLFKGIYQLEPGCYAIYDKKKLSKERYWNHLPCTDNSLRFSISSRELHDMFKRSVTLRMRSDVPVGTLLSGGIDSTAIVCDIHHRRLHKGKTFQTFTVDFEEQEFSEKKYVELTIKKTGFQPNYIFPKPKKLMDALDRILYYQELPFRSLSVYSQYSIYEYVKRNTDVVVLLNGQGGDELFAGYTDNYNSYLAEKVRMLKLFSFLREAKAISKNRNVPIIRLFVNALGKLMKSKGKDIPLMLRACSTRKLFRKEKLKKFLQREKHYPRFSKNIFQQDLFSNLAFSPLREYLRYEDRNSMAYSLEARLPFMDYNIIEKSYSYPDDFKIKNALTKRIVRNYARTICPREIMQRTDKMGFVSPQIVWLKTELRDEMAKVLMNRKLLEKECDFLNADNVIQSFVDYYQDRDDSNYYLFWRIYCYYRWKKYWIDDYEKNFNIGV